MSHRCAYWWAPATMMIIFVGAQAKRIIKTVHNLNRIREHKEIVTGFSQFFIKWSSWKRPMCGEAYIHISYIYIWNQIDNCVPLRQLYFEMQNYVSNHFVHFHLISIAHSIRLFSFLSYSLNKCINCMKRKKQIYFRLCLFSSFGKWKYNEPLRIDFYSHALNAICRFLFSSISSFWYSCTGVIMTLDKPIQ